MYHLYVRQLYAHDSIPDQADFLTFLVTLRMLSTPPCPWKDDLPEGLGWMLRLVATQPLQQKLVDIPPHQTSFSMVSLAPEDRVWRMYV